MMTMKKEIKILFEDKNFDTVVSDMLTYDRVGATPVAMEVKLSVNRDREMTYVGTLTLFEGDLAFPE